VSDPAAADKQWSQLTALGIDFDDVFEVLEREGVEKFVDSWTELLDSLNARLA